MTDITTLHAAIVDARRRLERAGIAPAEAALDADLLARHALGGWDQARLIVNWREPAPAGLVERFDPMVARRVRREPLAYIVGHREFWNLEIEVEPGVLIPRPETELIVEEVLACLATDSDRRVTDAGTACRAPTAPSWNRHTPESRESRLSAEALAKVEIPNPQSRAVHNAVRIADVGTGSGCLAIALARSLPAVHVIATDVSPAALAVAARNISRHEVQGRVTLVNCDLLDATAGPFDLIVSNPPYIAAGDPHLAHPSARLQCPAADHAGERTTLHPAGFD